MNFPQLIKEKRQILKESQADFGRRFDVSSTAVSLWESGQRQAPYSVLDFVLNGKQRPVVEWDVTTEQLEILTQVPSARPLTVENNVVLEVSGKESVYHVRTAP